MLAVVTHWGNASIIEMIWTAIGVVGVWYAQHNIRDARKYIVALEKLNGDKLPEHEQLSIIAFGHFRNEILRMAVFAVICMVGVLAMITPSASGSMHVSTTGLIVTFGLFTIGVLEIIKSALDKRQRQLLGRSAELQSRSA